MTGKPETQEQMMFTIVITPLMKNCGVSLLHVSDRARHVFQCGETRDYCVSGRFVCDGRVNCMLPNREGLDEENQFCSAAPTEEQGIESETLAGNCSNAPLCRQLLPYHLPANQI